jgi:hypothetical protein
MAQREPDQLVLWIGNSSYNVRLEMTSQPYIRLEKDNGDLYDISFESGTLNCTCPDHEFRRRGNDFMGCKHCRAVRATSLEWWTRLSTLNPDKMRTA